MENNNENFDFSISENQDEKVNNIFQTELLLKESCFVVRIFFRETGFSVSPILSKKYKNGDMQLVMENITKKNIEFMQCEYTGTSIIQNN